MRTGAQLLTKPIRVALLVSAAVLLLAASGRAQLAITEMMSAALKTNGMIILTNNSDFWELTNFGSNDVSLAGYQFSDNQGRLQPLPFSDFIRAHESVIFVRNNITVNDLQFRNWWGSCVAPDVRIRFYSRPGFSSNGDGIRVYNQIGTLVDAMDFGPATRGVSFVYDTNTGAFGAFSVLGQGGACQAATAADIASPGRTTGRIPLRIVEQPTNLLACLGVSATFKVSAVGMPRPRYQWLFNSVPIPRATGASFTVTNVTVADAGSYRVVMTNGLTVLHSSEAVLHVDTNPVPPSFVVPPVDATVVTNRTARFVASVCAFPAATYQWFSNGVVLAGATSRTLLVPDCTFAMSGAEFCLRVQNSEGTNTTCARLYVTAKPDLRLTEVQAYPVTGCEAHHDWFEVTNFGTNAVDLLGYRFSDEFSLDGSVTVTQSMVVEVRESVVFVKNPVPDIFIDWWGADQLPPGLKIYLYSGFSLFKGGDTLYLWNAAAEFPGEAIDFISFETNFVGVSQRFDFDSAPFGANSVPGEFGAVRAWPCGDIGSPGYTTNPPPRFVSITRNHAGAQVKWRGIEGARYRLEHSSMLPAHLWNAVGEITATNALPTLTDPGPVNTGHRFYRIRQLTP